MLKKNRSLRMTEDAWPLKTPFVIARGSRMEAKTLTVSLSQGGHTGRGECVPYARYGESLESVIEQIEGLRFELEMDLSREHLQARLPAGAARNAIDCALWDLDAKLSGQSVSELSGLRWPSNVPTVQTISILSPSEMGAEAKRLQDFPALKVKLNAENITERIEAVHAQAPKAAILVDANESWTAEILQDVAPVLAKMGVVMIEQPVAAGQDQTLTDYAGPIPIFADESCHTRKDLPKLAGLYNGINIKLDKTGGLTEAIALMRQGRTQGYDVMLGCMLGSSLAMAPAMFIANLADYVDLDGPALLAQDRDPPIIIQDGLISELPSALWGAPMP